MAQARVLVRKVVSIALIGLMSLFGVVAFAGPAAAASPPAASSPKAETQVVPPNNNSHYCDGCAPPLVYSGGPIAKTGGATGLTITPIYWIPSGTKPYIAGYQALINRYIADIAAASGSKSNVYAVTPQYYSVTGGTKTFLRYKYTAGTAIVDTHPFPANGCKPLAGYTNCITDAQLRTELTRLKTTMSLPVGLSHFYPVFTGPTVETQDLDGSNSASAFCGYHRAFGNAPNELAYGNEVYEADGCGEGQSPNNNIPGDSAISTLSHEIAEFVTDPTDDTAWRDGNGAEIGDICADDYGSPLGSTDPSDPDSTAYNQLINGHKYYTQTEFSNSAYARLGTGFGCRQSEATSAKPKPTAAAKVFIEADSSAVPADGKTTTGITVSVANQDLSPNVGDPVGFSTYIAAGTGTCGTLNKISGKTDANGSTVVTYTASKSDAVCAMVAKDGRAGKAATVKIYQGSFQSQAPTATDTFPTAMVADGKPITFTTTFGNRTETPIRHAAIDLVFFPGTAGINVQAAQLKLSYSTTGSAGPFTAAEITDSTDDQIQLRIGNLEGTTIPAHGKINVTYRLTIAPGSAHGITPKSLFDLEAYLVQVNPAAGTTSTIADTYASDFTVADAPASAPATSTSAWSLLPGSTGDTLPPTIRSEGLVWALGGVGILLCGFVLLLKPRRRAGGHS